MEDSTCQLNHRLLGQAIHRRMDFTGLANTYIHDSVSALSISFINDLGVLYQ